MLQTFVFFILLVWHLGQFVSVLSSQLLHLLLGILHAAMFWLETLFHQCLDMPRCRFLQFFRLDLKFRPNQNIVLHVVGLQLAEIRSYLGYNALVLFLFPLQFFEMSKQRVLAGFLGKLSCLLAALVARLPCYIESHSRLLLQTAASFFVQIWVSRFWIFAFLADCLGRFAK